MKFSNNFFTAGELAQLTGISKQLLIYYDKNKIFSPAFTAENGYRYYSLYQYYILEILITLRKMGLSLQEIRDYINNRGIENLTRLYTHKIREYSDTIADLQRKSLSLKNRVEHLNSLKELVIDEFLVYHIPDERKYVSVDISMKWPVKKRVTEIAEYMLPHLKDETSLNDNIAGVCLQKGCMTRNASYKLPYYSILIDLKAAKPGRHAREKIITVSSGLYLSINIPAHFGVIPRDYKDMILDFLDRNNLDITSDIFCFPLTNYWMVMSGEKELSRVIMKVAYRK